MRKIIFLLCAFPLFLSAQSDFKNSIKVNATGLATGIIAVQYERALGSNFSFNNSFIYRPEKSIPFGNEFDKLAKKHGLGITGVDFEYVFVNLAKIGVKSYSPELKYYFGDKRNRFFVSVFGQFEDFDALVPASLEAQYDGTVYTLDKVPINFDVKAISGGIMVGKQFKLGNRFVLDFVLIGPHFGAARTVYAKVETSILSRLEENDRRYLEDKIIDRFKLSESYFDVTVDEEKAEINAFKNVPYLGIRGFAFNLGMFF
ncbi:DUF3575 domain-containing protein [Arcticibacterium luteifluviistationis]|uniref:DUF3575 domain-containing protein n=1 Tax=Arcticibacterium luteifluviistationis TaxID=1784714 RepID=A0A2Z4GC92_9BACT|nr:DUF3575 domain-containing protein [Arcticibacterium luteifluviistationis]AWV98791.1 hypothetical protein DJ013_11640 [Arcticibacterium luteifluviistationis]